jgi:hypothetical protein
MGSLIIYVFPGFFRLKTLKNPREVLLLLSLLLVFGDGGVSQTQHTYTRCRNSSLFST